MINNIKLFTYFFLFLSVILSEIPPGYYNSANGLSGSSLQSALHEIINNHTKYPYTSSNTDVWDILKNVDEDPSNSSNVILLYTGRSQAKSENSGESSTAGNNRWNREHVWSKSHGFPNESDTAYTDIHHLRPADESVNSSRGNKDFDNGGTAHSEATDCNYDSDSWEPRDAVKGDVARMMFYMEVRYDPGVHTDGTNYDLELVDNTGTSGATFGKLSTLITWHTNDPVDDTERTRNDEVYSYQGNRNPFVDYPEFVSSIWGNGPLSPSNLATTSISENSLSLSWVDNATNETSYKVFKDEVLLETLNSNSTSIAINSLTKNTKYKFWVKSNNSDGESFPAEIYTTTKGVYISEVSEGTSYTTEFIELYNNHSSSTNLTGYKLIMVDASDNSSENVFDIGTDGDGGDVSIPGKGFLVISRGANESTFISGFSSFPSTASFYDGNTGLYFGTGTARKWRIRANDGIANTDDGTLIDETTAAAAGSGNRTIQNPIATFTTTSSSSGSNSTPGQLDIGQRLQSLTLSGNSGFRMLSSPVSGTIFNDLLSESWTQGIAGSDAGTDGTANIWILNQASQSWTELSNMSSSNLSAGQGFLFYVYDDIDFDGDSDLPTTLYVDGTSTTGNVTVSSIDNGDYYLAGNPYTQSIDWDLVSKTNMSSVVSVWDDASSSWKSWNGSTGDLTNGLIAPYQGFWIQANGGVGSITIQDSDISQTETTFFGRTLEHDSLMNISFEVNYAGQASFTYFSFQENGSQYIDKGDSRKILPLQATPRVEIMTYSEENPLKINNLPYPFDDSIIIPMDIMIFDVEENNFISQAGEVSFKWYIDDLISTVEIDLLDTYTGERINLNSIGSTGAFNFEIFESGSFSYQSNTINSQYPMSDDSRFQIILDNNNINIEKEPHLPQRFSVKRIYPNPFNPSIKVEVKGENSSEIILTIFNLNGTSIETINVNLTKSGVNEIVWTPKQIASGIYILKIVSKNHSFSQKVTFIK